MSECECECVGECECECECEGEAGQSGEMKLANFESEMVWGE